MALFSLPDETTQKMLFEPDRHLPLNKKPWNADDVAEEVRRIVNRLANDFTEGQLWPLPSSEDWDGDSPPTSVYLGASGILWTLDHLQAYRDGAMPFDLKEVAELSYAHFPDSEGTLFADHGSGESVGSWLLGETGVLAVLTRLLPHRAEEFWARSLKLANENIENPTLEALWGGTGTVIPALFRLESTSDEVWRDLLVRQCEFMRQVIGRHADPDCAVWEQDLHGYKMRYLGAGHGFAGNMYPFLRGAPWLPDNLVEWARETSVDTLVKTALVEDDRANWRPDPRSEKIAVQWCHGATGIIVSMDPLPVGYSDEFDALLVKAGELIWQAGPLTKGTALCHGTDGNGFALLKLYKRTGDPKWLERARAFAMHMVGMQPENYSLWEGDAGRKEGGERTWAQQ